MALHPAQYRREAGQDWLLSCADDLADTRRLWDADQLAPFPTGGHWLAAEVPLTHTMEAIKRIRPTELGPVLADTTQGLSWWLLPATLHDELADVRTVTVHARGWILRCPPVLYPVRGRVWLERPDGTGQLTDPVLLGAALGPGGPRLSAEAFG
ncbi:hypothetical protein [Streptomyces sp. NPDC002692]